MWFSVPCFRNVQGYRESMTLSHPSRDGALLEKDHVSPNTLHAIQAAHPFREIDSLEQKCDMINTSHIIEQGHGLAGYNLIEDEVRQIMLQILGHRPFRVASLSHERDGHLVVSAQEELTSLIRNILPKSVHVHSLRQEDVDSMQMYAGQFPEKYQQPARILQTENRIRQQFPDARFIVLVVNEKLIIRIQGEYKPHVAAMFMNDAQVEYLTEEEYNALMQTKAVTGTSQHVISDTESGDILPLHPHAA